MVEGLNNRKLVAVLIRKVLIGALTVGEAIRVFPFDTDDKSINSAYHALVHYEADEELRRADVLYREEQDEYLEMIAHLLDNGENLPDNIIRNYNKFYSGSGVPHKHDKQGAIKSFMRFLNIR